MKTAYLCFPLIILWGCFNNSSIQTGEDSPTFQVSPPSKRVLPQGYGWGRLASYNLKNQAEKNLLKQIRIYTYAVLEFDLKKASEHIYPDAIRFFAKFYPSTYSKEDIIKAFFAPVANKNGGLSIVEEYKKRGIKYELIISTISAQVSEEQNMLTLFDAQTNFYSDEIQTHTTEPDQTIGISLNGGSFWYFITLNEDSRAILQLRFKDETINKLLNK